MTSQQRLVLVVAILASFVAFLDGSVVNVALPAIQRELGGGLVVQQWVVDAYLVTLGALILLAGSLSDAYGRLRILRIGLLGFGVTSLLCAFAPDALVLIIGRGLQGAAGALLVPSSLAIIISTFSGVAQAKAIGIWTAWTGTAMIAGPVLGGIFVDTLSWRWVFAINVVPIALTLVLMMRIQHKDVRTPGARIDMVGSVLGIVGIGAPVFALIEQGRYGWGSPAVFVPLVVGLLSLAGFLWWENRATNPMLPLGLFQVRNFWVGNLATAAIYAALSFGFFSIAVFVQQTGGLSATAAGLATLPPTIIMLLLSSRFGTLSGKYGPRFFMSVGPFVAGIGFLLMLSVTGEFVYWTQLLPGILVFGLGLSMTVAPLTAAILGSIDSRQAGIGSAVNNAVSRIAGLIAIAFTGIIVGSGLDVDGFHRAVLATAIMLIAGAIISAIGIRNPKRMAGGAPSATDGAEVEGQAGSRPEGSPTEGHQGAGS
ncbi:MFS transporter [Compostimonas suwonensis]|uniref:EmrB/QacA subfamily drug resistance transporter n=1 Tax=Compostimonas suwonensis TaxID=1048394 RepID=A0A2M9BYR1_9MICO|nr:MFS transporter [Compostimonas suwonensis]PJJ63223.1 EmrB/QacA subfamily drug resistance transporter [Compostimonas suwonensis]